MEKMPSLRISDALRDQMTADAVPVQSGRLVLHHLRHFATRVDDAGI
jgi:hypothetical protein